MSARRARGGFTLVELLVVLAVVAMATGVLLPALSGARGAARGTRCAANVRALGVAWTLYATDHDGMAVPLAMLGDTRHPASDTRFWWGSDGAVTGTIDPGRGMLTPYLDAAMRPRGVYACPEQPQGTYTPQGRTGQFSPTYGYNGYYLSPAMTPGWAAGIGHRPHQRLGTIQSPASLLVFADTLLERGPGAKPTNNALLDPPRLFDGPGRWRTNPFPTSCFRHGGRGVGAACVAVHADGSAHAHTADSPRYLTNAKLGIGSIGNRNAPRYIPDADRW